MLEPGVAVQDVGDLPVDVARRCRRRHGRSAREIRVRRHLNAFVKSKSARSGVTPSLKVRPLHFK